MAKGSTFDLVTHRRDSKSGRVIQVNPYQLKVSKDEGRRFIRDGIIYDEAGNVIGKMASQQKQDKK